MLGVLLSTRSNRAQSEQDHTGSKESTVHAAILPHRRGR